MQLKCDFLATLELPLLLHTDKERERGREKEREKIGVLSQHKRLVELHEHDSDMTKARKESELITKLMALA